MTAHFMDEIKKTVDQFDPHRSNRYFLSGSAVRKERFHDIDLAVVGNKKSHKMLTELRDRFYDSRIPYKVNIVDLDAADDSFRNYVLHDEPLVWLK